MIILKSTTSLELKLGGSITTSQLPFYVAYVDSTSTNYIPSNTNGESNNTTVVTMLSSPALGETRTIKYISLDNSDSVSTQIIIQINGSSTIRKMVDFTLDSGDRLEYTDTVGFRVLTSIGEINIGSGSSGGGTWGSITGTLSAQTDLQTALDGKVDENATITGATKTKITYDAKGLVTSGADATTADIADSTNKRYVTDANLVVIGNTSGTNSGNETASTLGATINGASAAIPNDTDLVATAENAGLLKKITWTNVKAFLKTYFDTIYQTVLISGTSIKTINSTSLLGAGDISITPNATHTGEVTGTTALTVDKTAITNKTAVTIDTADYVLISDSSDSGNLKKGLVSDLGGFDDGDFTLVASFKSLYNY